ncbi:MAG: O-acetylhomoserine aminocarboxypropyltransferase/cysteine synthase [Rhodospirillales bacterium]|nr:O-acetylhomoserine aminocarboxypropyltransferase/cysteine synthase [Alphaproteobacteria bacterium]MCB9987673.1 O-acetylhomoserine aminocarboxypropyltransferase/cysteine synthase [Rhodospirillales bacterium]USO08026.1 MAG: O-acetylhomoserine aminocarboxypropyltransferase/cysteine synthase [Rhodospirillales bacterium]
MTHEAAKHFKGFETLAIHAGTPPDPVTGSRSMPVHFATAFVFRDASHAADLFALREFGYSYSRLTNPTINALEERLAALEGGIGATCAASGHGAQLLVFSALMRPGDHIVASARLYGGSVNQLKNVFPRTFGWQSTLVDPDDPENFRRAITEKTKAIFLEGMANPSGVVVDIEPVARIAEAHGIPLIVDNTLATPALCRPIEYGAHIVTHSTTKFLSAHGHAMGGAVVDGGKFDWARHKDKFPALGQPDPSYNGIVFADAFGRAALMVHNHAIGLRDLGVSQQPMNAFLTLQGIETLALRMPRHCENALAVARHLETHPKVKWVNYAGLPSSKYHALAQKYLGGRGGAVFAFGIRGGQAKGEKIISSMKLFSHVANIGDTRSLIIHPASTTHSQLSDEQKTALGIGPEVIRLSIGIENVDDLIADLDQALALI